MMALAVLSFLTGALVGGLVAEAIEVALWLGAVCGGTILSLVVVACAEGIV